MNCADEPSAGVTAPGYRGCGLRERAAQTSPNAALHSSTTAVTAGPRPVARGGDRQLAPAGGPKLISASRLAPSTPSTVTGTPPSATVRATSAAVLACSPSGLRRVTLALTRPGRPRSASARLGDRSGRRVLRPGLLGRRLDRVEVPALLGRHRGGDGAFDEGRRRHAHPLRVDQLEDQVRGEHR